MSILLSGDFHANARNEINSITKKTLVKKYQQEVFEKIKYHIILGDGGFMWPGNHKTDLFNYKVLAKRSFPILCVVGNHEPILGVNNAAEVDIGIGEKVLLVNDASPFVAYLKRGKIYTIDGIRFLVLGGALSIDKKLRKPNISWWESEYWSETEKQDLLKLLETENVFDCVLSHTGPDSINRIVFRHFFENLRSIHTPETGKLSDSGYAAELVDHDRIKDEVACLNDKIDAMIQCREWWCGHWHQDSYYYSTETNRGYHYLYENTKILDKMNDKNGDAR